MQATACCDYVLSTSVTPTSPTLKIKASVETQESIYVVGSNLIMYHILYATLLLLVVLSTKINLF